MRVKGIIAALLLAFCAASARAQALPGQPPALAPAALTQKLSDPAGLKDQPLSLRDAASELASSTGAAARLYSAAAELYAVLGMPEKAIRLLETYRGSGGNDQACLTRLAEYYEWGQAYGEARAVLQQLNGLYSGDPGTVARLVGMYRVAGSTAAAAALVDAQLRLDPADPRYITMLAEQRRFEGDAAGEAAALERLLQGGGNVDAYKRLGELYAGRGELERAATLLQGAATSMPDYAEGFTSHLGGLFYAAGQKERAVAVWGPLAASTQDPALRDYLQQRIEEVSLQPPTE